MLDETNFVAVERTSLENRGEPILRALKELKADESKAERIGKAAQHLVFEVLHPDNIDRSLSSHWHPFPPSSSVLTSGNVTLSARRESLPGIQGGHDFLSCVPIACKPSWSKAIAHARQPFNCLLATKACPVSSWIIL